MMDVAAVAVCLAMVACGSDDAPSTTGPAGSVLAVAGEVSAARPGAQARALAVRDPVFADDTVRTGERANVSIRLDHNGAVWRLGPASERVVRESVAWRAARTAGTLAGSITDGADRTASAGRHAERSAAQIGTRSGADVARGDTAPPPSDVPDAPGGYGRGLGGSGTVGKGAGSSAGGMAGRSAPGRPRVAIRDVRVLGPLHRDIVRRMLRRHVVKLKRCAERAVDDHMYEGALAIAFTATTSGALDRVVVTAEPHTDKIVTCVRTAVRSLIIPNAPGETAVEVDVVVSIPR